jgi:hypothetical protein
MDDLRWERGKAFIFVSTEIKVVMEEDTSGI